LSTGHLSTGRTMKAAVVTETGVQLRDVPVPTPKQNEILVRVRASGLNRADLWPAVEAGTLHLPIERTFPLEEAPVALAHMAANGHFGKIVLVT